MLSNKVCLVAALVGTLCPMADAGRVQDDLDLESAACHCACASSVSPVMFQNRKNQVYGTALYTGKMKTSDILYYVELRRLTQGFGDTSWSLMRSCSYEYCNTHEADKLCPVSKLDADTDTTFQFLKANRAKLLSEANAKLTPAGTPTHGWGISNKGISAKKSRLEQQASGHQQPPAILETDDPAVVVAVYWTALRSTQKTPIAERMIGWPFEPEKGQLAWGFEEVLDDPEELQVKQGPDMTGMSRGIMVTQELHDQLPLAK